MQRYLFGYTNIGVSDIFPTNSQNQAGYGAEGGRTPGLDIANVALSQLSYSPLIGKIYISVFTGTRSPPLYIQPPNEAFDMVQK